MATTNGTTPTTAPEDVLHKYQVYIDNHLPTVNEVYKFKETECPICYQKWSQGDTIVQTKCGHQFHKACLILWFETSVGEYMNNTCPSCRAPLYRKISVRSRRRELEVSHLDQRLRDALEARARLERGMRETPTRSHYIQAFPQALHGYSWGCWQFMKLPGLVCFGLIFCAYGAVFNYRKLAIIRKRHLAASGFELGSGIMEN
jgi:hypothetical protein